jgi:hypothetical protein
LVSRLHNRYGGRRLRDTRDSLVGAPRCALGAQHGKCDKRDDQDGRDGAEAARETAKPTRGWIGTPDADLGLRQGECARHCDAGQRLQEGDGAAQAFELGLARSALLQVRVDGCSLGRRGLPIQEG